MAFYRYPLRIDLEDEEQKAVGEFLMHDPRALSPSRNRFIIAAIAHYIHALDNQPDREMLEAIRSIFREELQTLPLSFALPDAQDPMPLSEAEQEQNDQNVLAALELFM